MPSPWSCAFSCGSAEDTGGAVRRRRKKRRTVRMMNETAAIDPTTGPAIHVLDRDVAIVELEGA